MKIKKSKVNLYIKTKKIVKLDFDVKKASNAILNAFILFEKLKKVYTVDVTLVTDGYIKKINKTNRNIDKPTDVLSFPMMCEDYDTNTTFLGDVIISLDKVIEQSKVYGHSLKREYCFLLCHSLLHLIGYDHIKKADELIMRKKQSLILDKVKINK